MKNLFYIITIFIFNCIRADSPAPPMPTITASEHRSCFFKMIPIQRKKVNGEYVVSKEAFGVAYRVEKDGTFTELWKTSGWFAFEVYLSNDGKYLVRMGPWNSGREPSKDDIALIFYKNGKLVKQYSTADLVKDKSAVFKSVTHYIWADRSSYYLSSYTKKFELKTLDNINYEFDLETGKILKEEKKDKRTKK